ncbi:MAG: hypothetical protein ACYC6Y_20960 [Thermoguttaceae bacterium]
MDTDFWGSLAICVCLVGAALWLIRVHWEHWEEVEADGSLTARERDHLKRRHRRRIQTSTMLGFVGVAILAGRLFPASDPSVVTVLYWSGVALLVLWMALLAVADMIATQVHYGTQRRKVEGERARLKAQLRRLEEKGQDEVAKTDGDEPKAEKPDGKGSPGA